MNKKEKSERLRLRNESDLTVETHRLEGGHPLHWHNYFEIEIILAGRGKYIINDVVYDISAHNVFFLNSTDFHYLEVDEVTELINISFNNNILDDRDAALLIADNNRRAYMFDNSDYERLFQAVNLLFYEYKTSGDCQKQLLEYVVRSLLRKNVINRDDVGQYENNVGIKKAIAYMEMHFAEKITLNAVASAVGYHPTYFSKLFASITGETYIDMLTRLRLGHAKSMLANGFSVSDACFQSGFGSLSNFLEMFKKHCKMTPSEYRKNATEKI